MLSDFTIFALHTEVPYIREAHNINQADVKQAKSGIGYGFHGLLSTIAKHYPGNCRGPFCIGVKWTSEKLSTWCNKLGTCMFDAATIQSNVLCKIWTVVWVWIVVSSIAVIGTPHKQCRMFCLAITCHAQWFSPLPCVVTALWFDILLWSLIARWFLHILCKAMWIFQLNIHLNTVLNRHVFFIQAATVFSSVNVVTFYHDTNTCQSGERHFAIQWKTFIQAAQTFCQPEIHHIPRGSPQASLSSSRCPNEITLLLQDKLTS